MKDYFLKFITQQQAMTELSSSGLIATSGPIGVANHSFAVDDVGVIAKSIDSTIENDVYLPGFQSVPGYHVNIRMISGELPDSLLQFCVNPNTPARVFG